MDWISMYGKKNRPGFEQIRDFLSESAFDAFTEFNEILLKKYNLGYVRPAFTKTHGWTYAYGRSGCLLVNRVCFLEDRFSVEGVDVKGPGDLPKAVAQVDAMFHDGFLVRYEAFDEARKARRMAKRKGTSEPDLRPAMRNNLIWPKKVSRQDLRRLYKSDAEGMPDEELLENIGLELYVRCREAKEIYGLMERYRIKCLHCGGVLGGPGILVCGCGREYTYQAYRKGFRENNMPRGAASAVFDQFLKDWMAARSAQEKMLRIDGLIHAFHIAAVSGAQGRPVGVNLIQGTKKQIVELIEALAGG